MPWTIDPRKFGNVVKEDHLNLCRMIALEIGSRLVLASPVGNPDLWKVNARNVYRRETYNLFAEAAGARRKSRKALNTDFPNRANGSYVGGRFRSNWIASVGTARDDVGEILSAGEAVERATAVINTTTFFPVIYLQDNLPYSKRLNEGHSTQAPSGFFEATIDSVVSAVNNRRAP